MISLETERVKFVVRQCFINVRRTPRCVDTNVRRNRTSWRIVNNLLHREVRVEYNEDAKYIGRKVFKFFSLSIFLAPGIFFDNKKNEKNYLRGGLNDSVF